MRTEFNTIRNIMTAALVAFTMEIQAQITTFQQIYPCNYDQSARDVLPTPDGGYLIAGETENATPGDTDLYMIKTDYLGNIVTTKTYGGAQPEYPHCLLATTDGNYFVVGYTMSYGAGNYDCWLLKMDANGDTLWTKTYGTPYDDMGKEIVPTSDGNYMIVGRTKVNNTNYNAWLMKINPSGSVLWMKYYGGPQYESARSVKQCLDGGYIFTGITYSYGPGGGDIWVVRTNSTGDTLWTKTYGGVNVDDGNWIVSNPDGSYTLTAETNSFGAGDMDVEAMKISGSGAVIWNKFYGGDKKDVSKTIQHTSDGGYVIAAISRSFGWVNPDFWVVKLDFNGDTLWTRHYGSWDHEHCYQVRQTSDGGYIALGHTRSYGPVIKIMFLKLDLNGGVTGAPDLFSQEPLMVYPNPAHEDVYITLPSYPPGSELGIMNALGEYVYRERLQDQLTQKKLELGEQKPGIYFITLRGEYGMTAQKIIIR